MDGSPQIITNNYQGPLDDFKSSDLNKDLTLLLFALDEITSNAKNKIDASNFHTSTASGVCSFWNTVHVVFAGATRGATEARLDDGKAGVIQEREEENGTNCSKLGGRGSSCSWGDAGCLSYQSYCCK